MHELSLACSVVELVEKELALHGGGSVRCIEITIGDLSGVDNDAFLFSLNMVLERSAEAIKHGWFRDKSFALPH